jgi:hypothetical protein
MRIGAEALKNAQMKVRSIIYGIGVSLLIVGTAQAAEYSNPELKFALTLPAGWKLSPDQFKDDLSAKHTDLLFDGPVEKTKKGDRDFYASVKMLPASVSLQHLSDKESGYIINEDASRTKIAKSALIQHRGFPARTLEGPATPDGDPGYYYALAIKPAANAGIILLVVTVDLETLKGAGTRLQIDQLLASFRPL